MLENPMASNCTLPRLPTKMVSNTPLHVHAVLPSINGSEMESICLYVAFNSAKP